MKKNIFMAALGLAILSSCTRTAGLDSDSETLTPELKSNSQKSSKRREALATSPVKISVLNVRAQPRGLRGVGHSWRFYLTATIPDGIDITEVKIKQGDIEITGWEVPNSQISTLPLPSNQKSYQFGYSVPGEQELQQYEYLSSDPNAPIVDPVYPTILRFDFGEYVEVIFKARNGKIYTNYRLVTSLPYEGQLPG